MAQIDAFFSMMQELGASDLHLSSGSQPIIRLHGILQRVKFKVLEHEELKQLLYEITPEPKIKEFEETGDVDFAYAVPGVSRYRVNFFLQSRGVAAAFRTIPEKVLSLDDLGMPPVLKDFCKLPKGLVLVTGPTGSGKSTTLAAMVDYINTMRQEHILTIEDPIEYQFRNKRSIVNQREVGSDTASLQIALKNALRQAPDVILIGEIRDRETMSSAMGFAQSGHLCLATLHANNSYHALNRILSFFPEEIRPTMLGELSAALKGVISQRLVRTVDGGRMPAVEVMLNTKLIADLIERGNFSGVKEAMEKSMAEGSQTFEEALAQLVRSGRIDRAEALAFADSPTNLMWRLENDVVKASHAAPSSQFAELATPGEDDMPSFTEIMLEVKPN